MGRNPRVFEHVGVGFDQVTSRYDALAEGYYTDNVQQVATKYSYDGIECAGSGLLDRGGGTVQRRSPGLHAG